MGNNITLDLSGTITIRDGGQLFHTSEGLRAIVEKNIEAYSDNGGYYLITNPVLDTLSPDNFDMTTNSYDLYRFDQSQAKEWQNYKQNNFNLENGIGYLYANDTIKKFSFSGLLNRANANINVPVTYVANAVFAGWNLVGNPFVCDAYLVGDRDFYVLDADGDEVTINTAATIAPMQGVFVQAAENESSVSFTTTEPSKGKVLNMSVTSNRDASTLRQAQGSAAIVIDNARIRFGEGRGLEKFQLDPNHSKLYIPQGGRDYAVVHSEGINEMPLNFKAEKDGTYTLSFNEKVEFSYLHLIDNITGEDVDLLALRQAQGPASYTFEAKTTDYENRFKLVFATICGDADGDNVK